ncbi:hypothetical protein IE53DRAFT_309913 [Violaceomyces palustris]|uniref:Uncharacterized protein n=1 Tax=Violaceomyces palustris TaxID=1673888 RepID=A0ACD0P670_9BASI|nr:hypothetical protein IE53DRAFT_309913 [Violaceomyces palustris]
MGRSLVLCFDGTGNSFKNENTNIVHFFSALKKGDPQQLVYYQPGIGMYDNCGEARKHESNYDKAFGATVGRHIKDGYRFLMQEYQANDIISILGFSRGAYTARTLAAMVNTMGLLPAFNDEQIGFAFRIFTDSFKSDAYEKLAKSFRKTFSMPVQVHFVGCFDTVSSIGVVEHPIPTTHVDVEIKYFRHALSLDERRGKFREQRWIHRQSGTGNGGFHRGDGDNHQPHGVVAGIDLDSMKGLLTPYSTPTPPEASQVKEIWFAGCHSDVGGGYIEDSVYYCLSRIPLRWMIRQCFECDTGIIFNVHGLWEQGIREINSLIHPSREPMRHRDDVIRNIVSLFSNQGVNGILNPIDRPGIIVTDGSISEQDMEDALDARKPIHDELSSASPW